MSRWLVVLGFLAACGSDPVPPDLSVEARGEYLVGSSPFVVEDTARSRTLTAQVWYPAGFPEQDVPVEELEDEPNRTAYADLLAAAPAGCPTRTAHVAYEIEPMQGDFPFVFFSHCHDCTRWSSFSIAERLASHGFVVVAVDHVDNTLWDYLDDTDVPLDEEFLPVREGDIEAVIDFVLAWTDWPGDPERIGMFGHSFGSVTAGLVAQDDDRIDAVMGIAAPMENPLLEGVSIAEIEQPAAFLVAQEDNSITEFGNSLIRDNYEQKPGAAWKIEVPDAGHWSFSDLVGVAEPFPAGCGEGVRQTDGSDFTYLDPEAGRAIAASYVTAFFKATLLDDAGAEAYLTSGQGGVDAVSR